MKKSDKELLLLLAGLMIFAITLPSFACKLSIPESYIPTFLSPPVSGHYQKCEDKPEEKCHCVEDVDPWTSVVADNMVLDFIRKEKAESCLDEADCAAKEAALICDLGKPIRTENEVYCAVEAYKKDGVKLVHSEAKKAAREAAEEALRADALQKEQEAQAAVDALVNIEDAKGTTIAALRAENNQLRALLRKALRALKK
jgi:hypothetical protein